MSGATWTDLRGGPRAGDLVADPVYPIELESDVVLRDGSTVRIRPARPGDRDRLEDYFNRDVPGDAQASGSGLSPSTSWARQRRRSIKTTCTT